MIFPWYSHDILSTFRDATQVAASARRASGQQGQRPERPERHEPRHLGGPEKWWNVYPLVICYSLLLKMVIFHMLVYQRVSFLEYWHIEDK